VADEVQGQAPEQPALPEAMNPHEAVGILSQALEAEEKAPEQPRDEKGKFKSAEAKTEEAKPETEAAEEKAEETPEEEAPEPRKLKLKYKGEELEKLEPEVLELAQKGFDYTQKMQQLAKEREEAQSKVKSEIETREKEYLTRLEAYKKYVEKVAGVESVDLNKLAAEDPSRAQQEFFKQLQFQQALQGIEAELRQAQQQRELQAKEVFNKQAREAVEKLQERVPGWNNDLYGKILKGAVDQYGFQQQEVNAITDHRAIEVLNDALKWREYQSAKPKTVEKRVAQVPKVQKPGTAEKPNPDADRLKDSMARLNKTGSRDAAQDVILQMLESGRL